MSQSLDVRDQFHVRLFHWSLREWEHEIATDLQMLRKVRGLGGYQCVKLLESVARERWPDIGRALAKHFHPKAMQLLGQDLDDGERILFEQCRTYRGQMLWPEQMRELPKGQQAIPRRRVATIVKSVLNSFGAAEPVVGTTVWSYAYRYQGWVIHTCLDVGGRSNDVTYDHDIAIGKERPFRRSISLLSCLGVSSTTRWRVLTEDEALFAAEAIAELTQHFLAAVPSLIGDE